MIFIGDSRSNERVYSQSGFCIYHCLESSNEYSYREGFMQSSTLKQGTSLFAARREIMIFMTFDRA